MRIRTVKPEFFRHERLQDLEAAHPGAYVMLVFQGLWCESDRNGIFLWKPRALRLDILPFLDYDLPATLALLEAEGFIRRYTHAGQEYGIIPTFTTHQRFSGKEAQEGGKHPLPDKFLQGTSRELPEKHPGTQERRKDIGKGKEEGGGNNACVREAATSASVDELSVKNETPDATPPSNALPIAYNDIAEIASWPDDDALLEAFARVRRIPSEHFGRYIGEFATDIAAAGSTHRSREDLRKHFLSWSEIHHRAESKPAGGKSGPGGHKTTLDRAAILTQVGQIAERFTEKTWIYIFRDQNDSAIRERAASAASAARKRFLTTPASAPAGRGETTALANLLPAS